MVTSCLRPAFNILKIRTINFGTVSVDNTREDVLLQQGDRDGKWPKIQPYLIALLTSKGTPLLSEGQEFCENYWIPNSGYGG
jgi:hypothetical protein